MPTLQIIFSMIISFLPRLIAAAAILLIGWWVGNIVSKIIAKPSSKKHTVADEGVKTFLSSAVKIVIRIIVIISSLATLGMDMTSIVTALGAAGVTLALALKDSLSNCASGILILLNRPFAIGDYVEIQGSTGTIERIELMFTTMRSDDNKAIVFPNSHMTSNKMINYTANDTRRTDVDISLDSEQSIEKVRECVKKYAKDEKLILDDHPTEVVVKDFSADKVTVTIRFWCKTTDYNDLCFLMHENLKKALAKDNIKISL